MKDNADKSHAYQRFLLVQEYSKKSTGFPPLNVLQHLTLCLQYLITRCQNEANAIIFGPLFINNKSSWAIHNFISFSSKDQVKIDGFINKVSVHFSTAPTVNKPEIWLFVMKAGSKWNEFDIVRYKRLQNIKKKTGIQTFSDLNMEIKKDQYLAIRFSLGAGNPIIIDGDQYYSDFEYEPHEATDIPFKIFKNKRIAMNFRVVPTGYASNSKFLRWLRYDCLPVINEYQVLDPFVQKSMEIYDSSSFERSIANEYWHDVINRMKRNDEQEKYQTNDSTHK
ncbi:unnamed protein product [Rotaria sp. Silwood2]|nr:unnamed protein product [Rotaria sp. Silwood2]